MDKIPTADQSMAKMVDTIHGIAQANIPQGVQVGKILAPPPNIVVQVNDIRLTKEDCYLHEYWLIGHKREAKGHIISETQPRAGGGGYAEFASHTHPIHNDYTDTIIYTDTLKVGDIVSVTPVWGQNDQLYIIGEKLVKL